MSYNILNQEDFEKLKKDQPERFGHELKGGEYLNLQDLELSALDGIDVTKLDKAARIMRGLIFCSLEASQSGHPGGSSSKTEQFLAKVLGGAMAFDPLDPDNLGRDRVVWSAGHCSPGLYSGLSLIYESLKKVGQKFDVKELGAIMAEDLLKFRRKGGPQGHIENNNPLSDVATGPSGHGLSAAGSLAIVHKSSGLDTKVWVFMGDAESEEGMSYEARNVLNTMGIDNLIVSLDYNHFGIDGMIEEVVDSPYINHWLGLGWNVIEVNGHDVLELIYAYRRAAIGFDNGHPTVVLAHGIKGKYYGKVANSEASHGSPAKHDEYVDILINLGFDIPGVQGEVMSDIEVVLSELDQELADYIVDRLEVAKKNIKPEKKLVGQMKKALAGRPMKNPIETQAFFTWLMKETAFFWAGAGDLAKSVLTSKAEEVYGLINRENPLGRGIRYGIAEQNMAMMGSAMTTDRLPGGFAPVSVFSSYGVFTSMMSNCVRLTLIGNYINPAKKGFFVMLAAHDGPETGEDGPTHQGMYWMSMFNAYPGIKVYKPLDANETIEMLFYAIEQGEPIALSVSRPNTAVFDRSNGVPPAREAINGAYIFKDYSNNGGQRRVLAISGSIMMVNTLEILPELENQGLDVKVLAVTSPELFEDLRANDPKRANKIFSDEERNYTTTIHNGWKGFLCPFLLPANYTKTTISIDNYLESGSVDEVYQIADMTSADIKAKIIQSTK
jgi:transketolase